MLHAGLNNDERIKRLRGAGKERETRTIGNSASITADICYPSEQGRQHWDHGAAKSADNEAMKGDRVSKSIHS